MPQVLLAKAARYPIGSTIVHRSGETIEADAADMDKLREMGVVADPTPAETPAPAAVEVESVAEETLEPDATSGGGTLLCQRRPRRFPSGRNTPASTTSS